MSSAPFSSPKSNTARSVVVESVDKSFGDVSVLEAIDLRVAPGESLALLGPSGCGKTTLLRLIAGLERPDRGSISVGDAEVAGQQWVAPEKRNVGMVFQDWALFPHLSVGKNIGYGLPRGQRDGERVTEALEMVGLADLRDRMPETLSGGQQQRVALARAIAPRPSVLLLDEPFSNLDSSLRVGVRSEVHRLLVDLGITSIFVTHDQEEAFVLGDRVAVMRGGVIEQIGEPNVIYENPSSAWIASFVGDVNLIIGEARQGDVSGCSAQTELGRIELRGVFTGPVEVLVRPEDLKIVPTGQGRPADIVLVEFYGHDQMLTLRFDSGSEAKIRIPARAPHYRGDRVDVVFDGNAAVAFAL